MAVEEKPAVRGPVATVVATAAVTLAIGITAAAFAGYLVPGRDVNEKMPADVTEPAVAEARPTAAQPSAPNVVLVPVAPDSQTVPTTVPDHSAGELQLAAYDPSGDHDGDDDEQNRGREHGGRDHEHDEDDHHDEN